jgi:ATP-binding cassette subfamily B protein
MLQAIRRSDEWALARALWRADRGRAAIWWALILFRGALPSAFVLAMGWLVAAVQHHRPLTAPLVVVGVAFVALNTLFSLHGVIAWELATKLSRYLHDKLMRACIDPPGLAHLEDPALADELSAARDFDVGMSGPDIAGAMPELTNSLVTMVGGSGQVLILFAYRWWAALLIAAGWGSTQVLLRSGAMWRARHSPEVMEQQRRASYEYRLAVDAPASKEIRLFGLAGWLSEAFRERRLWLLDASWRARRLRERPVRWCIVLIVASNAIVFASLARAASSGAVDLAHAIVFVQAAIGASAIAFGVEMWWISVASQPVPLVDGFAELTRPAGSLSPGVRQADGLPAREIRCRDVAFGYAKGPAVLDGFNLSVPAGSSLAIVGANGAGKTTIAKLLCRFYDPRSGAIEVDGIDLRELDVESWRTRVAAVFQDFARYDLPLRYNVSPAGASDELVARALERARAEGLADLDTILSRAYEGGTDLSGGQWQRVALARALCKVAQGAGLVILDEPTAQLDVRGEAEIFDRLLDATRGVTTILISHRFSTVRHTDRICVLDAGRVVELGSHDELMAHGGLYRRMFELQASRFFEESDAT